MSIKVMNNAKEMLFKHIIIPIKQRKTRKKHPADIRDLELNPVSRIFGLDRGTPIDRYYIESFLRLNKGYIKGDLLEIGENRYMKMYADKKSNFYILSYGETGDVAHDHIINGDLTDGHSMPENMIDCFICTQTLNFIYDVSSAIKGIYKVLKKGGVALVTVSAISQISRYDYERWGDYWRFTDMGITRKFEEVFGENNIKTMTYGNLVSVIAELKGMVVEDLEDKSLLDKEDLDYPCTIGIIAKKN